MSKIMNELIEWLNSPEGQESLEKTRKEMEFITEINNKYIDKFHDMPIERRAEIIEKIIKKYDSDEYYNREVFKHHRDPTCDLFWLLDEYAEKYGEELPEEENNPFPHTVRLIDGKYVIRVMHGQGSVVQVWDKAKY